MVCHFASTLKVHLNAQEDAARLRWHYHHPNSPPCSSNERAPHRPMIQSPGRSTRDAGRRLWLAGSPSLGIYIYMFSILSFFRQYPAFHPTNSEQLRRFPSHRILGGPPTRLVVGVAARQPAYFQTLKLETSIPGAGIQLPVVIPRYHQE